MRYAIISDVHSNLEALTRALEEIRKRGADRVICLGDVVGYGANPRECLKLVREVSNEIIMGNHDLAVEDLNVREDLVELAREAIEWTASVLTHEDKAVIREFAPLVIDPKSNVTWTHASLHEREEFPYLYTDKDARPSFLKLETSFCFFGHTHRPSLFSEKAQEARYLPEGTYSLFEGDRYLLNPGSVGQPRDQNPKLSFAFFDLEEHLFEIVRLGYDNRKAAEKIKRAGLPAYFAERLL